MPDILIVVEPNSSAATEQMVSALKRSILTECKPDTEAVHIEVVSSTKLSADDATIANRQLCPLTLELPETLSFPAKALYSACRETGRLRQRLVDWQYTTGAGSFWLPIVLTAKGPLYAEVIGVEAETTSATCLEPRYKQPVHLSDTQRQPLYALGHRLLRSLAAPPAVYLLQFGWQDDTLCFDRLLPFPTAPAIASLNLQTPDLFTCHWRCLTNQPIVELTIG